MAQIYLPISVANRIREHEYVKNLSCAETADNPICPKCERVALRDIGWQENSIGCCPHCGYRGKMEVTLREYAKNKLYK